MNKIKDLPDCPAEGKAAGIDLLQLFV